MAALKKTTNGFQDQLSHYAGQKYCRMLQWEHSAILSTFIKLPFVITIFVLPIFEWPFYTGFNVHILATITFVTVKNKIEYTVLTADRVSRQTSIILAYAKLRNCWLPSGTCRLWTFCTYLKGNQ